MKENWFFEKELPKTIQNYKIGWRLKKKIYSGKSKYQKIEILDTFGLGRILALDGIIQLSKKYEFIYHEMISNLALFSHPDPERILIIGGGDGGVLREVLKHPLKEIYFVELDPKVIEISKKYLQFMKLKSSLKDKRVKFFLEDGAKFVKKFKNFFDVVIADSTDPSGPSKILFSEKFYQAVFNALSKEGIFITQSGNFINQFPEIKSIYKKLKSIFHFVRVHRVPIFDYQLTDFSFTMASKKTNLEKLNLKVIKNRFENLPASKNLKYYSPEIHLASAILPKFYQQKLWKNF